MLLEEPPLKSNHPIYRLGCRVTVPARTSISVLDMNRFRPGIAGGGNLGFAFGAYTTIELTIAEQDEVLDTHSTYWQDERGALVSHVLKAWRDVSRLTFGYRVTVISVNSPHIGLASSGALQCAVWYALNHIHGYRFSDAQLRRLVAISYREVNQTKLEHGFTTGLSSFLGLYGGFAVVGPNLNALHHFHLPNWSAAIVLPRHTISTSFGTTEADVLMGRGRELDATYARHKQKIITSRLVPAIRRRDLAESGAAIESLQSTGSKMAEMEIYSQTITPTIQMLRQAGICCVFMSAVGPGLALVSEAPLVRLTVLLAELDVDVRWIGTLDNTGVQVVSVSTPDPHAGARA